MACRKAEALSELQFAHALMDRDEELTECTGDLVQMEFFPFRVHDLERVFDSEVASDLLWDGYVVDAVTVVRFELCCGHWFDLAVLIELRASQHNRQDWRAMAAQLLQSLCERAGWDPKELLNMMAWSRERLT